jgi:hypothetical protein
LREERPRASGRSGPGIGKERPKSIWKVRPRTSGRKDDPRASGRKDTPRPSERKDSLRASGKKGLRRYHGNNCGGSP